MERERERETLHVVRSYLGEAGRLRSQQFQGIRRWVSSISHNKYQIPYINNYSNKDFFMLWRFHDPCILKYYWIFYFLSLLFGEIANFLEKISIFPGKFMGVFLWCEKWRIWLGKGGPWRRHRHGQSQQSLRLWFLCAFWWNDPFTDSETWVGERVVSEWASI